MISNIVLVVSAVILLCLLAENISGKMGIPALIFFMFVGMVFGSDGLFRIPFDDFKAAETVCSIALIFIIFDGGFNTRWRNAKKVLVKSLSLSTIGVVLTALITTVCCHIFLKMSYIESFLIGSVLGSTDAASVFAILQGNDMELKDSTSPILEVESGSNDPMAYLLTITAIGMITGQTGNIILTIIVQLTVGSLTGIAFAKASQKILLRKDLSGEGLSTIFTLAMTMLCYAVTDKLGGNAYLSVYILGLYLGNTRITKRKQIVSFFSELTSLLQIGIFFVIGLLSFPRTMPGSIPHALGVMFILTFIARPLMVLILLLPQKCSIRQCLLISWAGLRGASSIVFAITAVSATEEIGIDLFHIAFLVSLLSISVQGSLLPTVAKKLDLVEEQKKDFKNVHDYQEAVDFHFVRSKIKKDDPWIGKKIMELQMPFESQIMMIKRNGTTMAAKGRTKIKEGDEIIFNVPPYHPGKKEKLMEIFVHHNDPWIGQKIADLPIKDNELIIKIFRGDDTLIPDGKTTIESHDVLVIYRAEDN